MTCSPIHNGRQTGQPAIIAIAGFLLFAALSATTAAAATPGEYWQPQDPQAVIVTLPDPGTSGTALDRMRHQLLDDPANATLATWFTTTALKHYAVNGDPRYLGYADGVLQHWQSDPTPPQSIWLLRGRLKQTQHRFAAAAEDLERLIKQSPGNAEALALAADARRRSGDLAAARRHCLNLQLSGYTAMARLCAADTLLSLGEFSQAWDLARETALAAASESPGTQSWAWSVAGDAAFGLQRYSAAEDAYSTALELAPSPPLALRLAFVDVHIETQRHAAAWTQLNALPPTTAVLLRQAIIAKDYKPERLSELRSEVQQRLSGAGADELHWSDRAMFALLIEENPTQALAFAKRNWKVQKGWDDALLLKKTATAAGDTLAGEQLANWRLSRQGTTP